MRARYPVLCIWLTKQLCGKGYGNVLHSSRDSSQIKPPLESSLSSGSTRRNQEILELAGKSLEQPRTRDSHLLPGFHGGHGMERQCAADLRFLGRDKSVAVSALQPDRGRLHHRASTTTVRHTDGDKNGKKKAKLVRITGRMHPGDYSVCILLG